MKHSVFSKTLSGLLVICMLFSILAVPFSIPAFAATVRSVSSTANANTSDGIVLTKSAALNSDATVDLTIEAYTTGHVSTPNKAVPTDIVLVLDVSGSMDDPITTTHEEWTKLYATSESSFGRTYWEVDRGNYFYKQLYINVDGSYVQVTPSNRYDSENVRYYSYRSGSTTRYVYPIAQNNANIDRQYDYDVVQFYELKSTTSSSSETKMEMLHIAVNKFIENTEARNSLIENDADKHRIAIVKFADDSYADGKLSTNEGNDTFRQSGNDYNYTQLVKNFTTVNSTGAAELENAINSINAGGATAIDYGLELAEYVISERDEYVGRNVVVIVFADGEPNHSNGYDASVAAAAINTARDLKAEGVTVYSISVVNGANASELGDNETNRFMHYLSSNYPTASASTNNNSITPGEGSPSNGYYYTPDAAHNLDLLFKSISDEIGTPSIELGEEAKVVDKISDYFSIGISGTNPKIEVKTSAAKADGSWDDAVSDSSVAAVLDADGKTVTVTGFDFDEHYVSKTPRNGDYYGKKLVITVNLLPDYEAIDASGITEPLFPTNNGNAQVLDTNNSSIAETSSPVLPANTVTYKVDGEIYKTLYRFPGSEDLEVIEAPEKEGYTFSGWSSTDIDVSSPFTMPEKDIVIEGSFTANKYYVSYRYSGVVPSDATALPNGGNKIEVTFGDTYTLVPDATASGYAFYGWESAYDDVVVNDDKFVMPDHDVELYGYFEAGHNTPYHIEHYLEQTDGSYKLEERVGKMGETDTTVTLIPNKYEGFEGDETHPDNVLSGTVTGDGKLVLKMHYTRFKYDVTYVIEGNVPAGVTVPAKTEDVYFGESVKLADDLYAAGYKFSGWTVTNKGVVPDENGYFTMPNIDVVVSGSFTNALDTPYKVEHYLENADGTYGNGQGSLDPARVNEYEGETGADVTATPIPVTRYILNGSHPSTVATATVAADGSTVLKLYYDRREYKVTYIIDGYVPSGVELPDEKIYTYGETVTVADSLEIDGYDFVGWYDDAIDTDPNYVDLSSGSFTMPPADVVIAGYFTAKTDTKYMVEHYLENLDGTYGTGLGGTTPTASELFMGTTGATAYASPLNVTGFTFDDGIAGTKASGKVTADGNLVLKLYYARNEYDITYIIDGFAPAGVSIPSSYNQTDVKCGETVSVEAALNVDGYDFVGWYNDANPTGPNWVEITNGSTFTMPAADVVIAGYFTRADDTPYQVVHYFENLDGTYGNGKGATTPARTDSFTGTTGERAAYTTMKPTGYVFDPSLTVESPDEFISPSGDTVISLYYNREEFSVTYIIDGFIPAGAQSLIPDSFTAEFNESVTVADNISIAGYVFSGWKDDAHPSDPNWRDITAGGMFKMPADDVVIEGSFERSTNTGYKVEHYFESLDGIYGDGNGSITPAREDFFTGVTDAQVVAHPISATGFEVNYGHPSTKSEGVIAPDGGLVLKLYYDRAEYTVSYIINGFKPADAVIPTGGSYKYGESVDVADDVTAIDYVFSGWRNNANPTNPSYVAIVSGGGFEMPAADVVILGTFTALPDVNYHVLHYLENPDGSFGNGNGGTTPATREEFYSKAGREVEANAIPYIGFVLDPTNENTKAFGTIPSSGTLVLKLYYIRNEYSVRYRYTGTIPAGAPELPNGGHKIMTDYGSTYVIEDAPTLYGYTFYGWTSQTVGLEIVNGEFTMPAHEVYLVGHFHENVETPYVVNHWLEDRQGNYTDIPYETETRHAPHSTEATVYAKHFAGFTFDADTTVGEVGNGIHAHITKTVAEDGTTVFDFYYNRDKYNVNYTYVGTVPASAPALPSDGNKISVYFGSYHYLEEEPTVDGYDFNGWRVKDNVIALSDGFFKMPRKDVTLEGHFTARNDIPYTVRYFFEELDGEYAENTSMRQNKVGVTDSVVTADVPSVDGFVPKRDNVISGRVSADPTLVIDIYYDRARYNVVYNIVGVTPDGVEIPVSYNKTGVKYGENVSVEPDLALEGYRFVSWRSLDTDLSAGSFDMPARNVSIYGRFIKLYTVKYDLNGGNAGSVDFSDEVVESGTEVSVKDAPTRPGYTFKGWTGSDADYSAGDKVVVERDYTFKAEWKKNGGGNEVYPTYAKYTLTYVSNGGTEYSPEKYMEGAMAKVDKTPERHGYVFEGWFFDEEFKNPVEDIKVVMNKDVTVYAKWLEDKVPEALDGEHHFAYVIGYDDGTVRPDANITRAETAAIFFRLLKAEVRDANLSNESAFDDVKSGDWFNINVATLEKLGVLIAREGNSFAPSAAITRGEFADICARFDEDPYAIVDNFSDVKGHKFENQIHEAAAHGWIGGYEDGSFRPDELITRAEAMKMINRVLNRELSDIKSLIEDGMIKWPDNADTTAWYYLDVQEATNNHKFILKDDKYEEWTELTDGTDWLKFQ